MSKHTVEVTINGRRHSAEVEARVSLSEFLRDRVGYTGVHVGCDHGVCGACTVIVEGRAVRSCLMLAVQADAAEITTVEGLAEPNGALHPVQEVLADEYGLQCGFCTPGIAMTLAALTAGDQQPSEAELVHALSGHLCRCTGYQGIRRAARRLAAAGAALDHHGDQR